MIASAVVAATCLGQTGSQPADDGWVPLFNGKDLSGWKVPNPPSNQFKEVAGKAGPDGQVTAYVGVLKDGTEETLWRVDGGLLVGAGHASHLFTEGEYADFRYRVEAKINDKGNSGQYFRTKFGPGFPAGYEAQLNATHQDQVKTGSLYPGGRLAKFKDAITVMNTAPHGPDEFFTQEVVADGNEITILVNGKQTVRFTDPDRTYTRGHFALQGHDPGTVVTFRKVEYKPLRK